MASYVLDLSEVQCLICKVETVRSLPLPQGVEEVEKEKDRKEIKGDNVYELLCLRNFKYSVNLIIRTLTSVSFMYRALD